MPITVGGAGAREAVYVTLGARLFHMPESDALAASLALWLAHLIVGAIGGIVRLASPDSSHTCDVFPDWKQAKRRAASSLADMSASLPVRIAVATFFVLLHLALFSRAGHQRLGLPFNSYPDERPYFSNPDATPFEVPRQPHRWSRLLVSRFDAQHHIATAERGISACPQHAADGGART